MNETWTPKEKAAFAKDWADGMTVDHMAEKYKRTPAAIKRTRARMGLESRHIGDTVMVRVRLPQNIHAELLAVARKRKTTLSVVLRSAIDRELSPV